MLLSFYVDLSELPTFRRCILCHYPFDSGFLVLSNRPRRQVATVGGQETTMQGCKAEAGARKETQVSLLTVVS